MNKKCCVLKKPEFTQTFVLSFYCNPLHDVCLFLICFLQYLPASGALIFLRMLGRSRERDSKVLTLMPAPRSLRDSLQLNACSDTVLYAAAVYAVNCLAFILLRQETIYRKAAFCFPFLVFKNHLEPLIIR